MDNYVRSTENYVRTTYNYGQLRTNYGVSTELNTKFDPIFEHVEKNCANYGQTVDSNYGELRRNYVRSTDNYGQLRTTTDTPYFDELRTIRRCDQAITVLLIV